jgi:hypothetical protein
MHDILRFWLYLLQILFSYLCVLLESKRCESRGHFIHRPVYPSMATKAGEGIWIERMAECHSRLHYLISISSLNTRICCMNTSIVHKQWPVFGLEVYVLLVAQENTNQDTRQWRTCSFSPWPCIGCFCFWRPVSAIGLLSGYIAKSPPRQSA